ncbi:MAG: PLP-dependent lyase/thiolase, partial [Kosmotogaceae bacterium]|nr:PLP-dependent lyase/thiolase [Kosmotogaceae bacterium]
QDSPGRTISIPQHHSQIAYKDVNMIELRKSYIKQLLKQGVMLIESDYDYLSAELKISVAEARQLVKEVSGNVDPEK